MFLDLAQPSLGELDACFTLKKVHQHAHPLAGGQPLLYYRRQSPKWAIDDAYLTVRGYAFAASNHVVGVFPVAQELNDGGIQR